MWIVYVATKASDGSSLQPVVVQPQVRCGSVYVGVGDTTQKVTQRAVTSTAVGEKKRRAGKYTVAVGTTHGHVQAFLDDTDNVLTTLDKCQAEEKCLMLIKRPKESARKMLKSQSLSNLSGSDQYLGRQFNGLPLSQVHQHAQTVDPVFQETRGSDQQPGSSNGLSYTEPRGRYISGRDKTWRHQLQPAASSSPRSCCPTDSPPDYHQYVARRDRDSARRGLRYSSIPEDEDQEINNNNNNKGCSSPSMRPDNRNTSDCSQLEKGYQVQGQVQGPRQGQNQLTNSHSYNPHCQRMSEMPLIHDPGDSENSCPSETLNSQSSAPTFSLVGRQKPDSRDESSSSMMQGLPLPPQSLGHQEHLPPPQQSPRHHQHISPPLQSPKRQHHPPSPVKSSGQPRNDGEYYCGTVQSLNGTSPRHVSYPEHSRPKRGDAVYSLPRKPNEHCNSIHNPPRYTYQYLQNGAQDGYTLTPSSRNDGRQYDAGHVMREQFSQCTQFPPKPKRSLQLSAVNETSERLKRFTEVMRCRMSGAGRADRSPCSSMSQTPTTPTSLQQSSADNVWDSEVSTLLEVRLSSDGDESPSAKLLAEGERLNVFGPQQNSSSRVGQSEVNGDQRCSASNPSSSQELYVDPHGDCSQSCCTSHSHSSTMDSGYTTNTEGDGDSSINLSQQFSPPYHPTFSHPNPFHLAHAEPYRPVPLPRSLSLVPARKINLRNSDVARHGHPCHSTDSEKVTSPHNCASSSRDQNALNCVVHSQIPDHQRRSWDSGRSFKSLDFTPVSEDGEEDTTSSACEDFVVKPQAVAVNQTSSFTGCVKDDDLLLLKKSDHAGRQSSPLKDSGAGDSHDGKEDRESHDDLPSSSNNVISVPGHWSYNKVNDGNSVNNNDASCSNIINANDSGISNNVSKTPVRAVSVPTLFQLSQSHSMSCVKLSLPGAVTVGSILTLDTAQVTLPALNVDITSGACNSPHGQCARLGGPGSAFRPVKTAGGGLVTMELTALACTNKPCDDMTTMGEMQAGDLLLEVNGWQCAGNEVSCVQTVLDTTLGEVTLVVARKKEETVDNRVQQLETSVEKLELEVQRLNGELAERQGRIEQLSSMLQCGQDQDTGQTTLILDSEDGPFVIGENEFVV